MLIIAICAAIMALVLAGFCWSLAEKGDLVALQAGFFAVLLLVLSLVSMWRWAHDSPKKRDTPWVPEVQVTTANGVSDTLYIYR